MTESPHDESFQRARTDDQKQVRRDAILKAARARLTQVGFERFSMSPLAKAAGVARGTLYLYFPTREELLYAVHMEALHAWKDAFLAHTHAGMGVEAYLAAYFDTAQGTPLILETLPRVPTVLERNLSTETLVEGKRDNRAIAMVVGERTAEAIDVPLPTAYAIARGLLALLVGTTQALARPEVDLAALPEDVQLDLAAMNPREAFLEAALWMVRGAP